VHFIAALKLESRGLPNKFFTTPQLPPSLPKSFLDSKVFSSLTNLLNKIVIFFWGFSYLTTPSRLTGRLTLIGAFGLFGTLRHAKSCQRILQQRDVVHKSKEERAARESTSDSKGRLFIPLQVPMTKICFPPMASMIPLCSVRLLPEESWNTRKAHPAASAYAPPLLSGPHAVPGIARLASSGSERARRGIAGEKFPRLAGLEFLCVFLFLDDDFVAKPDVSGFLW